MTSNINTFDEERCLRLDLSQTWYASVHKKELNELIECYNSEIAYPGNQQATAAVAVIIEAPSGTGKTVLVDRFCRYIVDAEAAPKQNQNQSGETSNEKMTALVCRGKFEELAAVSEPFAAIVQAVNQLICQLVPPPGDDDVQESGESSTLWRERLQEGMGTEIASLEIIFPKLAEVFAARSTDSALSVAASSSSAAEDMDSIHSTSASSSSKTKEDSFGSLEGADWRFERFRFAFRSFFRIVSTHIPLVFVLDDLHWADPDSLQLIRTLLDDGRPNRKFMFVAAMRPMNQYPTLQAAFAGEHAVHATEPRFMRLGNLNVIDIAFLLVDLLERNHGLLQPVQQDKQLQEGETGDRDDVAVVVDESTMAMAEAIYKKTGGNSFVIVQLLRILENKKLLVQYTTMESSNKWQWNLEGIGSESSIVSDNVTQVVAECLESIDIRQKQALTTAAIFGVSCFEVTTIVHAMQLLQENIFDASTETAPSLEELSHGSSMTASSFLDGNCSVDDALDPFEVNSNVRLMNSLLRDAARHGFVVEIAPGRFKFGHDRIRDAAYTFLPDEGTHAKRMLHLKIGRQLRSWTDQSCELGMSSAFTEESLLFHATKQLNLGSSLIEDSWESLDLAEQNFACAELAARKTSFFLAVEYLEQGLKHLGDQPWQDHYALTHKLSVALTRILYSCGKFHGSMSAADDVLKHGKSFKHKQIVYHTKFLCLLQQGNVHEAHDLILGVLKELGLNLPRRFLRFHIATGLRKVVRRLNAMSDEEMLNLPAAKEKVNGLAGFLIRLIETSNKGSEPLYFHLGFINLVQLMLEHGHCSVSALALMGWVIAQADLGDFNSFSRSGKLVLQLAARGKSRHDLRARVTFWTFASGLKVPMRDGIAPLKMAIKEYWEYGAIDCAFQDMHTTFRLMFASGEPLGNIAQDFESAAESLLDYKQHIHWNVNAPLFQAVDSLMGKTEDPSALIGKFIEQEDHANMEKMGNVKVLDQYCFFSMTLAYYFHKYELAEEKIAQLQSHQKSSFGCQVLLNAFYSGLVFLARFKTTAKCKYRRMATVQYRRLRRWADNGSESCIHMHQLLRAEMKSTSAGSVTDIDSVRREYDHAIESAASLGFRNHVALANERAGMYLNAFERQTATPYLSRAADFYREWGAEAKVKDLRARYGDQLSMTRHAT